MNIQPLFPSNDATESSKVNRLGIVVEGVATPESNDVKPFVRTSSARCIQCASSALMDVSIMFGTITKKTASAQAMMIVLCFNGPHLAIWIGHDYTCFWIEETLTKTFFVLRVSW